MKARFLLFIMLQLFVKGLSNAQIDDGDDDSEDSDRMDSTWCSAGNGWYSDITRREIAENRPVVRLSWNSLPFNFNGSYSVLLFNMNFNKAEMRVEKTNSTSIRITSLKYDEKYTAFVCYNASENFLNNIMSSNTKFIPQCGYCYTTFTLLQSSTASEGILATEEPTTLGTPNVKTFTTSEPLYLQVTTSEPLYLQDYDISKYTVILMSTLPVTAIVAVVLIIGIALLYKYAKMKARMKAMESSYLSVRKVTDSKSAIQKEDVLMEKLLKKRLPEEIFISPSNLCVSDVIGQGEFGVIYKGVLKSKNGATQTEVAVKMLRGIFTTGNDMEAITKEIIRMSQFDYLNVMSLIGVCMAPSGLVKESASTSIVMPFMAKGSLLDYLRMESEHLCTANEDEALKVRKPLVQICYQIAKGMEYLAGEKYVHRDLAARNCLIDENYVIKVSDFGLTEKTYSQNYFRQAVGGAKLPIKWMAIESIKFGVYSEKTDVWSYGVTCWEVFSGGAVPYPGTHPRDILAYLEEGGRLLKPANAALFNKMDNVMQSCWRANKDSRPTFSGIVHILETYLATVSNYTDLNNLMTGREEEPKPKLSMSISHGFINRIAMATRDSYNDYYVADV